MKSQELTMLYVFDAIMTEGSITRAADRLSMTQPAVSNAVARMRNLWHDPLFVKSGRKIEPTAFALSLWEQVRDPIHHLSQSVNASKFDPSKSQRKFRIAVGDITVDMLWLPLIQIISEAAPLADVYAIPFTLEGAIDQLREAHIDLAIGPLTHHDHSLRSTWLFESHYLLAMGKHHPLAKKKVITLDDFLAEKHLLVTTSLNINGFVDQVLQRQGLKRRIAATVNHFSAVPKMLLNTDLIAVIPQFVAGGTQYRSELSLRESPVDVDPTSVYLIWHTRHDRDPGLLWLRDLVEKTAKRQWQECAHCVGREPQAGQEPVTLM